MAMKGSKSRRGFWAGVFAGLFLAWLLSKLRLDPDRAARVAYNFFAPFYDPFLELFAGLDEVRQAVVDRLSLEPGDQVLEVCVGTGANLPFIAQHIGSKGMIFGIDISEGMLAQAKKKLAEIPCPVELRCGYAEDLPYPNDYFDAVLNFGAMNFIADRKKAIDEMVRVAKPSAKIVFCDEAIAPDGSMRTLLSCIVLTLISRLRPPMDLVPEPGARLSYLANGFIYVIDWQKPLVVL